MSVINNKTENNETNLQLLKNKISGELNYQNELVRINNVYGVLLSDNTFLVAKETSRKESYCTTYILENFFTERLIKYKIINHNNNDKSIPWHSEEIFYVDSGLKAIVFPIREVLHKHIKCGIAAKRNISLAFEEVNTYLKENPTFIDDTFKEMESSKHI